MLIELDLFQETPGIFQRLKLDLLTNSVKNIESAMLTQNVDKKQFNLLPTKTDQLPI